MVVIGNWKNCLKINDSGDWNPKGRKYLTKLKSIQYRVKSNPGERQEKYWVATTMQAQDVYKEFFQTPNLNRFNEVLIWFTLLGLRH